jgi:hypothetical protein
MNPAAPVTRMRIVLVMSWDSVRSHAALPTKLYSYTSVLCSRSGASADSTYSQRRHIARETFSSRSTISTVTGSSIVLEMSAVIAGVGGSSLPASHRSFAGPTSPQSTSTSVDRLARYLSRPIDSLAIITNVLGLLVLIERSRCQLFL